MLSPSNEPRNYSRFTPQWAADNYAKDQSPALFRRHRLGGSVAGQSAARNSPRLSASAKANLRNPSGWFGSDYRDALENVHIPVLAHEVGQWCAYPDFDVIKKFTGYLQPGNYEIFKYIAEQQGVLDEDKDFAWASGRFQLECYKEEIEANLRTPGLAGFQLLDLHDYLGQGTALIGVLDAFWESKGYVTPEEFRKFCGPVVPLARLKKRVFTTDEKFEVPMGVANFGSNTLDECAVVRWEVRDEHRKSMLSACHPRISIGLILPRSVSKANAAAQEWALTICPRLRQYKLVSHDSSSAERQPFCRTTGTSGCIPHTSKIPKPAMCSSRAFGRTPRKNSPPAERCCSCRTPPILILTKCPPMRNVPVFWNIQMTVRPPRNPRPRFDAFLGLLCDTNSPALAEFPTDKNCDWQWTQLINGVRSVNLDRRAESHCVRLSGRLTTGTATGSSA